MVPDVDAWDLGFFLGPEPQGDDASAIGLEGEVDEVEPLF